MIRSTRTLAAAAVGTLVAVLAAGAALAQAGGPSIRASRTTVDYPGRVTISGVLSSGATAAGRQVELQANPYPYSGFQTVAQATTGRDGSYSFAAQPRIDTRYRVATSGQAPLASATVSVTEEPGGTVQPCNYCGARALPLPRGGFVIRQQGTEAFPPGAVLPAWARVEYVYVAYNFAGRAGRPLPGTVEHLVGAAGMLTPLGGGRYRWRIAFHAPAGLFDFWFYSCFRDAPGFGPLNGRHNCGVARTTAYPNGEYMG